MTLSWPRLTWPARDARQAGPRWRKMSATSTTGRDNGRASAGHLPQKVERAGHLADRADGGTPGCQANDPMQLARTRMLPAVAGKQPGLTGRHPALLARDAPPFMQYLKQDGRENDVSILLALALLDPDEHPVTIDIGELERYDLRGSQAGGISQAQDRPVLGVRRRREQPTDLLRAQNNGQAARLAGRDELLGKIVAFQCDLEEEPQCSGGDVGGSHRRADRGQP